MLRKLITLFALLTGLAAIGAPVHARASVIPGIDLVSSAQLGSKCAQEATKRSENRKRPAAEANAEKKPCPKPSGTIVYFPPVMLQADRARE